MFPGATKGGGQCFGFPDVCKTPSPAGPVPIPYPNFGLLNQAAKTAKMKATLMYIMKGSASEV